MKPKLQIHGGSGEWRALLGVLFLLAITVLPGAAQDFDFGDSPSPYPTTLKDNGARHIVTEVRLGFELDSEKDGIPSPFALGDDNDNTQDEDGVNFLTALAPGQVATIEVTLSGVGQARLEGWIDFGADGSWADKDDRIFSSRVITNGVNKLSFLVPQESKIGPTFARFRVSTGGDLNFTGPAQNGEVEDYRISIGEVADYGDAPTKSYPTLLSQNGARHQIVANFMLGTKIDGEGDGQPNNTATGDDIIPQNVDDEDGIVFTSLITAGSNATVQVTCTMNKDIKGFLNAWMDFNADGDWNDKDEQIFQDIQVGDGTVTLTFAVPSYASAGPTFARFRLNSDGKLGTTGAAKDGEVEDYQVSIVGALDFGDAPNDGEKLRYPTLLSQNGARHIFTNTFCLGKFVDGEADGQPSTDSLGDDDAPKGNDDDEDGVTFTSGLSAGATASVTIDVTGVNVTGGPVGVINAWIDFNRDGDWADAGEQIFTNRAVLAGANNLTFIVPAGAQEGTTYSRFRLNRQGGLSFTGLATDGEVEDHTVNISPDLDFGDAPPPYPTTLKDDGARHDISRSIHLGLRADAEQDGQPNAGASGDDLNPAQADDEDGVLFTSAIIGGNSATVQVVASVAGFLHAWIDFNGNGSWADAGEKIFNGISIAAGTNNLSFSVPAAVKTGPSFSRFRYTTLNTTVNITGRVANGEVEDHPVRLLTDRDRCDHNCEGREYWLTFPGNYAPDPSNPAVLTLCLKGVAGTTATVSVPGIGFSTNVIIPAAQNLRVTLPRAAEMGDLNDVVTNNGIHVVASMPISITAYDHARFTSDSYMALHTSILGTDYVVMGFGNTQTGVPPLNGTQFAIVATESNTIVAIRPTATAGGRTAGVAYAILMQPGDTYQLRSTNDAPADLSGTLIKASKPIGVFGSHQCANVPTKDVWFCNYLVEQLLPVNTWGSDFYTAPLAARTGGDTFRVLAGYDNTLFAINGTIQPVLNRGEFRQFQLSVRSRIVSSKPVFVAQYANSGDFDGNTNSDPFMLTVPATRHYAASYRICTPTNDFPTNYLHLVAPTSFTNTIVLNGGNVGGAFTAIAGTTYSAARILIAPGNHFVSGGAPFGASVYGWAEYDAYGHPACMYFGDVVPPRITTSVASATVSVNDYPNSPGFVPAPDFARASTAVDNCDVEQRLPEQDPKPGAYVPPGVHVITVSQTDFNGNIGEANVTLTVVDPSPVVIDCPQNISVNCGGNNGAVVTFQVNAHSTYDTNVPVVSIPASGSFFPAGTTTVTNIATSLAGKTNICTFTVTVLCDTRINVVPGLNNLTLSWVGTATLQFATNPAGPWNNLYNGPGGFVAPLTNRQGYFRVRY